MYLLSVVELVTVCIVVALECVRAALDEDFSPWEDGLLEGVAVAVLREGDGWNHFLLCLVNAFICLM